MSSFRLVKERNGMQEFQLASNGLRVLIVPRALGDVIGLTVHYNVGSRHEATGYTGSAHFLEHLLFKGSKNFQEPFDAICARTGALSNATTGRDRTNYFEIFLPEHLDLFMRLEADRMVNAAFTNKDRQDEMTVVRNELELSKNRPALVLSDHVAAIAVLQHPYHHPVIGWEADVEGVSTERIRQFYEDAYHPDNALIVLVGDVHTDTVLSMVEKHFGAIPPAAHQLPSVYTQEPPQKGERRIVIRKVSALGFLNLAWMTPGASHADTAALKVLQDLLTESQQSILKREFVNTGRVFNMGASQNILRDPSLFSINCAMLKPQGHAELENDIRACLNTLKTGSISENLVEHIKLFIKANVSYERDDLIDIMRNLSAAEGAGSWELYFDTVQKVASVTVEDVVRVLNDYFFDDNCTVGWLIPKEGEETEGAGND